MTQQHGGTGRNYLLLSVFVVLLADQIFGLGLSLMPGLSFKNLVLYSVIVYLASSAVIQGNFSTVAIPPFYSVFILLCVYGMASWAVSTVVLDNYQSLRHLMSLKNQLVDPLLFFSVVFFGCRNKGDTIWIASRLLWVFAIASVILLLDFVNLPDLGLMEDREDGRLEGAVGGTNNFATLLMFFVVAMGSMTLVRGRSLVVVVGSLAAFALILLSGSRGALAGLVASVLVTTFLLRRQIDLRHFVKLGVVALVVITAIVAITVTFYPDMFLDRLERTGSGTIAAASSGRTVFWTYGLLRMWESPYSLLVGFGWDTFAYSLIYPDPHSHYMFIFYSTGVVGLGLFLYVLTAIVRSAINALDDADATERRFLIAFLYGYVALLFSITFNTLYTPWPFIWGYAGLMTKLAWLIHDQPVTATSEDSGPRVGAPKLERPTVARSHR